MSIYFKTLGGQSLYQAQDVYVYQNLFYRWLMFQDHSSIQTLIHRRKPHKPLMDYILPFTLALHAHPGSTCLMGLGGGAVAHFIAPFLKTHPCYAIEANAQVIAIAAKYFMTDRLNFKIIHQKAEEFAQQTPLSFQHILIDIYTDTGFPEMNSLAFFKQCRTLLHPKGFLALNLVNIEKEFILFDHLRQIFEQSTVCIIRPRLKNVIVLATPDREQLLPFLNTHPRIHQLNWDSTFGYVASVL